MARAPWAIVEHHQRLLQSECGSEVKEPGGRLQAVLLFPNTYLVGMANLGLQTVYGLINQRSDALCERAFLPDSELQELYRKARAPLASLESSRPLGDFDLVLASLSFENDAPNLLAMLAAAGLGLSAAQRQGPLVVAGGVACMLNPEPLAEVMDGFLLGEAEAVLGPFLDAFLGCARLTRDEALLSLAQQVPGFYAPRFYQATYQDGGALSSFEPRAEVPARISVPRYQGPASGLAQSRITAPGPQFGDRHLIEVGRGCGHGCRFCAAGHIMRPPRLGSGEDFARAATQASSQVGAVGLVSAAVSDLPGIDRLASQVLAAGGKLSISSLRADNVTPALARALAQSGLRSAALAPEAGSPRLRRSLNKDLADEQIFRAVELLISAGVPNLRLYFMLGLPGEEARDLEALVALARQVRSQVVSLSRAQGRLGRVTLSISPFVPKPFTPFQWEAMAPLAELRRRLKFLQKRLAGLPNLRLTHDVAKYSLLQGVLARGDRRLAPLLSELAGGAPLNKAYGRAGVDPAFYANRTRPRGELLPWAHLDHGISFDYLWQEARQARQGRLSPPCSPHDCRRCGIC